MDTKIDDILKMLAASMGELSMVRQRDGFVYVGPPTDQDRVSAVFAVAAGDAGAWAGVYQLGGTVGAEVRSNGDLLIVRDTVQGVQRVADIHRAISTTRRQYRIEVVSVELTEEQVDRLGVRLTGSGTSRLVFGTSGDVGFEAVVLAALDAEKNRIKASQVRATQLQVIEGGSAKVDSGDQVNVPRRVVSDQGTVTDVGYESFQTGLQVEISARSIVDGMVRLDVKSNMSELRGIANGLPQINQRTFSSSAFVARGGVVVIGGVSREDVELAGDQVPGFEWFTGRSRRARAGRMYLFLRLNEVL